jgi:hypothetical protein
VGIMVRPCHAIDAGWIEADGAFYTRRLQLFVGFEKGYMGFEREKESSGRTYLKQDKPQHERAKLEGWSAAGRTSALWRATKVGRSRPWFWATRVGDYVRTR